MHGICFWYIGPLQGVEEVHNRSPLRQKIGSLLVLFSPKNLGGHHVVTTEHTFPMHYNVANLYSFQNLGMQKIFIDMCIKSCV